MHQSSRGSTAAAELIGVGVAAVVGAYVAKRTNRVAAAIVVLLVVPIVERSVTRIATAVGI